MSLIKKIASKMKEKAISIDMKLKEFKAKTTHILADNRGDGFVDTAIKILISVVVGAVLLTGLYILMKDTVLVSLTSTVNEMFGYTSTLS